LGWPLDGIQDLYGFLDLDQAIRDGF